MNNLTAIANELKNVYRLYQLTCNDAKSKWQDEVSNRYFEEFSDPYHQRFSQLLPELEMLIRRIDEAERDIDQM